MHELTGDRDAVLEVMKQTIFHLGQSTAPPSAKSSAKTPKRAAASPRSISERDAVVGQLKRALDRERDKTARDGQALTPKAAAAQSARGRAKAGPVMPSESTAKEWYMPRDRTVAVFQAAMDEYLAAKTAAPQLPKRPRGAAKTIPSPAAAQAGPVDLGVFFQAPKPNARAKAPAGAEMRPKGLLEKYSNIDPGWASVVFEKMKAMLRGNATFVAHKSATDFRFDDLPQQATIALVSDWGGGNEAARQVAAQIKARQPNYVIHLGDIYYAGTEREVDERFLKHWDFASPALTRSFALNGNHEMYSGGHAYFKMLKKLKQPASYFRLGNQHWRFIGLDTAYVDHDLNPEQQQWLAAQLNGGPAGAKSVLLSHHQPFSAFERANTGEVLRERVREFTDAGKIHGWMWGHEHLCVIYDRHLGLKGRCIGHGCIPYEPPRDPQAGDVNVLWWNKRKQQGGGIQGFALLKIDGPRMDIEYIDEDGAVAKTEENYQDAATVLR